MVARRGAEYLDGLEARSRSVWLGDSKVTNVVKEPQFAQAAETLSGWFDLQYEYPDDLLIADPETGESINVSHMQPRSREDLKRRHVGLQRISEMTFGMMGRTPDYMNVTFAGFSDDRQRWSGPDGSNEAGWERLVQFQKRLRRSDLSLTHTIVNPTINKESDASFANNPVPLHKVGETKDAIIVRGARMLATLAPFADEQTVYPASPLPPDASPAHALSFTVSMETPGLVFLCRDGAARPSEDRFDSPFSTRFDEQDAYCIFDDVEVPKQNVFIDGDIGVYGNVMMASTWWPNVMQQTTIRALTKLEFCYGLASAMVKAINDTSPDATEMLGELISYIEMTRNAILAAEDYCITQPDGGVYPDARALHPMRALLPLWLTRATDIIRTLGGANLLTTPSRAMLDAPELQGLIAEFLPGALGTTPERRSAVFRLAWDFVGSTLGSRGDLYERHYLASTKRNWQAAERLYSATNRTRGDDLLRRALA